MAIRIRPDHVRLDPGEPALFVVDPTGPVLRDLELRMGRVQMKARNRVGVRTGRTLSSIRKQNRFTRTQVSVDVVAGWRGAKHIGIQEYGSPPHIIQVRNRGKRTRKSLRFIAGGQVIFRTRVRHPGTRGTRFLTSSLPLAGG